MSRSQRGKSSCTDATRTVVEKVAEAEGVSPIELTPPLSEVIDPDALNQLFASTAPAGRTEGRVVFSYGGYDVSVYSDGAVSIEARGGVRNEHDVSHP